MGTKHSSLRRFGLIGHPLGHSLSPYIHERIMEAAGIHGEYRLYDLAPKGLSSDLPILMKTLDGFNCTIPHKEAIIPYLKKLNPSAKGYGAVNTVFQGEGYNTDGAGFRACQVPMEGFRVQVLGAGGVARVLCLEASRAGASEVVVRARNKERGQKLVSDMRQLGVDRISLASGDLAPDWDVLLNGTPLGMWPQSGELPVEREQIGNFKAVFDTVYNPTATRLILQAKSKGLWAKGGLEMLFEQALAAQKIWNPAVNFNQVKDELAEIQGGLAREIFRKNPIKLVLTGFMGSGKTTVGRALAKELEGFSFVDLDEVITLRAGCSISEIFACQGERTFRNLERECLLEKLGGADPVVLSTGGGTLVQPGAMEAVRKAGALVVYLDVSLETALQRVGTDSGLDPNRPLASEPNLYELRRPLYEEASDLRVLADGEGGEIIKVILSAFDLSSKYVIKEKIGEVYS